MKRFGAVVASFLALALAVTSFALGEGRYFYVSDGASVISDADEETVKQTNEALFALTGAEIVVVTQSHTDNLHATAKAIIEENEIGSLERSNGILLLISADDGGYWCIPTDGIGEVLDEKTLDGIIEASLIPFIAKRDYSTAAATFVTDTASALTTAYGVDLSSYNGMVGAFSKVGKTKTEQVGMTKAFRTLLYASLVFLGVIILTIFAIIIRNKISKEQRHTIRRRRSSKASTALTFARGIDSRRR